MADESSDNSGRSPAQALIHIPPDSEDTISVDSFACSALQPMFITSTSLAGSTGRLSTTTKFAELAVSPIGERDGLGCYVISAVLRSATRRATSHGRNLCKNYTLSPCVHSETREQLSWGTAVSGSRSVFTARLV